MTFARQTQRNKDAIKIRWEYYPKDRNVVNFSDLEEVSGNTELGLGTTANIEVRKAYGLYVFCKIACSEVFCAQFKVPKLHRMFFIAESRYKVI